MKPLAYYEINHSQFYGYIFTIKNVDDFNTALNLIKNEHKKATHFVYCYKLYTDHQLIFKRSDDGEPKGYGTMPMVNLMEKEQLNNIAIIVVRYFGKAKLGGSKLMQSYNKITHLSYHNWVTIQNS